MNFGWAALALALAEPAPLQPLIDAAEEGATVTPPPGRYLGPVVIDKRLTLDGKGAVTIDGRGHGTVVTVKAPEVTVKGVRVTGSGRGYDAIDAAIEAEGDRATIAHVEIDDVLFGVTLKEVSGATICGNRISSSDDEPGLRGDGVRIWSGGHNVVFGNDLLRVRDLTLANSEANQVVNNRIREGRFGLQLVFSPGTVIEGNLFDGNLTGIAVLYSPNVEVRRNRVLRSTGPAGAGLVFKDSGQATVEDNSFVHCSTGAKTNAPTTELAAVSFRRNLFAHDVAGVDVYGENGGHVFEGNRFEHNLSQVTVSAPMSARGQTWRGNQWDDYQGFDRNGDGVGDVPYERWAFADRIWLEEPKATFFRNSPLMELIDFLERLAPFASPELTLRDEKPSTGAPVQPQWEPFELRCPEER